MGIMGAAGMLATSTLLPIMGKINDNYTLAALKPAQTAIVLQQAAEKNVPGAADLIQELETKELKELPAGHVVGVMYGAQNAGIEETGKVLNPALAKGGAMSFRYVVILPCVLVIVFLIIFLSDKAKGGYKVVKLDGQ